MLPALHVIPRGLTVLEHAGNIAEGPVTEPEPVAINIFIARFTGRNM